MEKIAVFLNSKDEADNFYDCKKMRIYEYQSEGFVFEKEVQFNGVRPTSPRQIMADTIEIAEMIKDCSTVAFGDIAGVAYSVFDRKNFHIFSIPDDSEGTLAGIHKDLCELKELEEKRKELIKDTKPHETETPGVYYFDLLKAQEFNPELTSKQALKEFLDKTPFMELRLKGAHVPPWIKKDGRFDIQEQKIQDAVYILVTRRQCNERNRRYTP